MARALWRWGPLVGYALALFAVSADPQPVGAGLANDKLLHALAYAVLAWLGCRAGRGVVPGGRGGAASTGLALALLHGAGVELCQRSIPGRHGSVGDFLADVLGAGIGVALASLRWRVADPPWEG